MSNYTLTDNSVSVATSNTETSNFDRLLNFYFSATLTEEQRGFIEILEKRGTQILIPNVGDDPRTMLEHKAVLVTVDYAKFVVDQHHDPNNRNFASYEESIDWKNVIRLATDMQYGKFHSRGTIGIDPDLGYLTNGNHRFQAQIKSGKPAIYQPVINGQKEKMTDVSKPLAPKNQLPLGTKNRDLVAAVANKLVPFDTQETVTMTDGQVRRDAKFSPQRFSEYAANQAEAINNAHEVLAPYKKYLTSTLVNDGLNLSYNTIVTCYVLFNRDNPEKAKGFFQALVQGERLLELREKYAKGKVCSVAAAKYRLAYEGEQVANGKASIRKLSEKFVMGILFKAWAAWLEKRQLSFRELNYRDRTVVENETEDGEVKERPAEPLKVTAGMRRPLKGY